MAKTRSGILVSFEGTEGSGKSTLIREVACLLDQQSVAWIQTREPGGNPLAEKIRSLLLHNAMSPWTELLLYQAARAEHLEQTLLPALLAGKIILCDRFTDSTLAYQSYARGLPWSQVKTLNRIATQGVSPHLTVFLDLNPAIGLKRASDPNRFEAEGLEFHKKVRSGFLKARGERPKQWLTLKVENQTPQALALRVFQALIKRFPSHFNHLKTPLRTRA
ncbi:MAG: dTMP kinase [Bdellovibrionia bacterium]